MFALSSSPPEKDPDILSILLFGKTRAELERGEIVSPMSADRLLMQVLSQTFGRDIRTVTGLDELQLQAEEIDNIKLTMGKQLTRRLGTKYSVETQKGDFVQRAAAEYRILENISLTGYRDTEGAFGAQMQFRLEFQ
jgi:autotransporter translocation and assembly factor TamB